MGARFPSRITPVDLQPETRSIARKGISSRHPRARSPVPLDLHKSLGKRGEGAAKSKVEDRFLTRRIKGIPREGEGQGLAVLRRVEEARKVVPPSHGRGIYGGPMVVEFLVLFMGRCTMPTIDWKYVYSGMVYTWLTLRNRILPSGGCSRRRKASILPSIIPEQLLVQGVELWPPHWVYIYI